MKNIRIFVDSDVVISSLLSKTGAAYLLVNSSFPTMKYISDLSIMELKKVATKLNIEEKFLDKTIGKLDIIPIKKSAEDIKKDFIRYVHDKDDAHIVAGAIKAEARFLITYNIKDYKTNKLKTDHNIITITPGSFLQYLRGLSLH